MAPVEFADDRRHLYDLRPRPNYADNLAPAHLVQSFSRKYRDHFLLWLAAGHSSFALADVYVDLASDSEFAFEVNPGLNREARSRDQHSLVFCLEVVDVRAVAVNFSVNVMARAMNEVVAVSCFLNDIAANVIDLPTVDRSARAESLFHAICCRVARVSYHVEYFGHLVGHPVAHE